MQVFLSYRRSDSAFAAQALRYALRFAGCMVHAVLLDGAPMLAERDLPGDLRWFAQRSASALGGPALGQQIDALVAEVPRLASRPRGVARVLWVDDEPANNEVERSLLRRRDRRLRACTAVDRRPRAHAVLLAAAGTRNPRSVTATARNRRSPRVVLPRQCDPCDAVSFTPPSSRSST